MKINFIAGLFALSLSTSGLAQTSDLFVKENGKLINITKFLADEPVDADTAFCYKGNSAAVMNQIKQLAKVNENFFCDGCGGGFAFRSVTLLRGIVTYDIVIKVEDEVVPGEFSRILVKPCL